MADPHSNAANSNNNREKKTKGRRPIPIKKIENETTLLTTFCKRRVGLFRKANELCTLCAVQMALIVFSPGKKPHSFGHPSVESVMGQFLAREEDNVSFFSVANHDCNLLQNNSAMVEKLNEELAETKNRAKGVKKYGDELGRMSNASKNKSWWKKPLNDMNLSELEECKKAMEELATIFATKNEMDLAGNVSLDLSL